LGGNKQKWRLGCHWKKIKLGLLHLRGGQGVEIERSGEMKTGVYSEKILHCSNCTEELSMAEFDYKATCAVCDCSFYDDQMQPIYCIEVFGGNKHYHEKCVPKEMMNP
jgi:hypothetical protein